ncbi:MAG: (d)CMP kinase [Rickettsiales bacterium]|nr:(d)CMP kinase [Rickettsiales bacterium]
MIIAIDGPSASGKGTLAKKLADHFDFPCLNTGSLYRAIAYDVVRSCLDPNDFDDKIEYLTANISQEDLENDELFSENIGAVASIIAKNQKLRNALFRFQKEFIRISEEEDGGVVIEGRDTTTVICPDADFKFFVLADVEVRAKRRFEQLKKKGDDISYAKILEQLKKRDENDFNRKHSPLKVADGAVIIDNGKLSIDEGFKLALKHINKK